jgi:putative ABC transport system permease protein
VKLEALIDDVRLGFRALSRRPVFVLVAMGSLAIGIGINVAVFTVLNAILLRPLAVPDPGSLIMIGSPTLTFAQQSLLREMLAGEGELLAFRSDGSASLDDGRPAVPVETVSSNYFAALGVRPTLGRFFEDGEAPEGGGERDVVVSHALWTARLGADPSIVGRTLRLGRLRAQAQVIGVAPPEFRGVGGPMASDMWMRPSRAEMRLLKPPAAWSALLRARPGEGVAKVRTLVESAISRLPGIDPEARRHVSVIGLVEVERLVWLLVGIFMTVPGLVLLVACANVSGLLAARAEERREEMAVRLAIGGSRARLIQQLLTEGALLAIGAAALGILLARWMVDALSPWLLPTLANYAMHPDLRLDLRAAVVAVGLAAVAAIAASLLPALAASRPDLSPLLKGQVRSSPGHRRLPYRDFLVVAQLVVTFAFVVTAVLCNRTLARGLQPSLGFAPERLLAVALYRGDVKPSEAATTFDSLLERVRQIPEAQQATLAETAPATPAATTLVRTPEMPGDVAPAARNAVRPEYFDLSGARLARGRLFDDADVRLDRPVAVVTIALARRLWPDADPLGRTILVGDSSSHIEVVGIVPDPPETAGLERGPGKIGRPLVYVPLGARSLSTERALTLLVQSRSTVGPLGREVSRTIRDLYPALIVGGTQSLAEINRAGLIQVEITSVVYSALGALCVLLGTVGVFGSISQAVRRRTREIGIRMAIGATRTEVVRLVLRRGLALTAIGLALGMPAAFAAVRVFGSAVPDLPPVDAATLAVGALLVTASALGASYWPARWAADVDPVTALRHD